MSPAPRNVAAVTGGAARAAPSIGGVVEMRVRTLDQLFDPVDPSPPGERDLGQWSEEYIVESVKEMQASEGNDPPAEFELVLVLGEPAAVKPDVGAVQSAVRAHFTRQAALRGRALRRLFRRGGISLAIGLAFLVLCFALSRVALTMLGEGTGQTLLREGSLIVGWVAMWRPIEIFLYDWWPIVGERRLYERLGRVSVRIVDGTPVPSAPGGGPPPDGVRMAARAISRWENEGGHLAVTASPPQKEPFSSRP